jgi:hypothetical protein
VKPLLSQLCFCLPHLVPCEAFVRLFQCISFCPISDGCFVSDDHVTIRCMTVPGTGHLHNISVTIDGERSLFQPDVHVSYGSPSILSYSDVGSYHAFTRGSQVCLQHLGFLWLALLY